MNITHETLLENGWTHEPENGRYVNNTDPYFVLFLSANYGVNNNYLVKLIKTEPHVAFDTIDVNINCITIADLRALKYLFNKAGALSKVKQVLLNY
jgi:hypothetical protein